MESRQIRTILRWSWLLIIFPIISVGVALYYLQVQPPTYEARATLIIGPGIDNPNPDLNDLRAGEQLMQTYAELPTTNSFLDNLRDELDLSVSRNELADIISIRPVVGTQLLRIVVQDGNADRAMNIVNAVADNLVLLGPSDGTSQLLLDRISEQALNLEEDIVLIEERINTLQSQLAIEDDIVNQNLISQQIADEEARLTESNNTLAGLYEVLQRPTTNRIEIIERANDAVQVSSQTLPTLIVATGAGVMISVLVAIALLILESDVLDVNNLSAISDLPVWATVKEYGKKNKLVVIDAPDSELARKYYQIGALLLYQRDTEDIQSMMFTSLTTPDPVPELVGNIASAIARSQNSVFLLDVNFRTNQTKEMFNLDETTELSDLLTQGPIGAIKLGDVDPYPHLKVLPSGLAKTEHSFDMLASPKMLKILRLLKQSSQNYRSLLMMAPPMPEMDDSLTLVSQVDAIVLVIKNRSVTVTQVRETVARMAALGGRVSGILLIR